MQSLENIQGNMTFLASELPMPFENPSKTYFAIAEGRALKPILVPGQAIDESIKESRMLDGQLPMNHPKWKQAAQYVPMGFPSYNIEVRKPPFLTFDGHGALFQNVC
jgi:hypothetical protein